MNERQRRFLEAYIIEPNATQAAITAGYSPKTSYQQGARLLKHVEIKNAIAAARESQRVRSDVEAGDVIRELARISFAKLSDVVTWTAGGSVTLKPSAELPDDIAAAVKSIRVTDKGITITMHDKKGALDSLMRLLGLFDADQRVGGDTHYHLPAGLSLDDLRALAYDRRVVDAQFEEGES
jgi:phage terminase small subunit